MIAPYPPELLPNTPRRPSPPHPKRCSIAGSISCSRKSSHAPIDAELMYWLPPSRVKQSGKATTTGGMRSSPISRSSRSGRFSRKPTQFVWDRPLPVKPARSTSSGNPRPSCPAGTYTSTSRVDGSPSMLVLSTCALDGNAADGSRRPEKFTHMCCPPRTPDRRASDASSFACSRDKTWSDPTAPTRPSTAPAASWRRG